MAMASPYGLEEGRWMGEFGPPGGAAWRNVGIKSRRSRGIVFITEGVESHTRRHPATVIAVHRSICDSKIARKKIFLRWCRCYPAAVTWCPWDAATAAGIRQPRK